MTSGAFEGRRPAALALVLVLVLLSVLAVRAAVTAARNNELAPPDWVEDHDIAALRAMEFAGRYHPVYRLCATVPADPLYASHGHPASLTPQGNGFWVYEDGGQPHVSMDCGLETSRPGEAPASAVRFTADVYLSDAPAGALACDDPEFDQIGDIGGERYEGCRRERPNEVDYQLRDDNAVVFCGAKSESHDLLETLAADVFPICEQTLDALATSRPDGLWGTGGAFWSL